MNSIKNKVIPLLFVICYFPIPAIADIYESEVYKTLSTPWLKIKGNDYKHSTDLVEEAESALLKVREIKSANTASGKNYNLLTVLVCYLEFYVFTEKVYSNETTFDESIINAKEYYELSKLWVENRGDKKKNRDSKISDLILYIHNRHDKIKEPFGSSSNFSKEFYPTLYENHLFIAVEKGNKVNRMPVFNGFGVISRWINSDIEADTRTSIDTQPCSDCMDCEKYRTQLGMVWKSKDPSLLHTNDVGFLFKQYFFCAKILKKDSIIAAATALEMANNHNLKPQGYKELLFAMQKYALGGLFNPEHDFLSMDRANLIIKGGSIQQAKKDAKELRNANVSLTKLIETEIIDANDAFSGCQPFYYKNTGECNLGISLGFKMLEGCKSSSFEAYEYDLGEFISPDIRKAHQRLIELLDKLYATGDVNDDGLEIFVTAYSDNTNWKGFQTADEGFTLQYYLNRSSVLSKKILIEGEKFKDDEKLAVLRAYKILKSLKIVNEGKYADAKIHLNIITGSENRGIDVQVQTPNALKSKKYMSSSKLVQSILCK